MYKICFSLGAYGSIYCAEVKYILNTFIIKINPLPRGDPLVVILEYFVQSNHVSSPSFKMDIISSIIIVGKIGIDHISRYTIGGGGVTHAFSTIKKFNSDPITIWPSYTYYLIKKPNIFILMLMFLLLGCH